MASELWIAIAITAVALTWLIVVVSSWRRRPTLDPGTQRFVRMQLGAPGCERCAGLGDIGDVVRMACPSCLVRRKLRTAWVCRKHCTEVYVRGGQIRCESCDLEPIAPGSVFYDPDSGVNDCFAAGEEGPDRR